MRISKFQVYHYRLPLNAQITLGGVKLSSRDGIVIKLTNHDGHVGLGDIAALPPFSIESPDAVHCQLRLAQFFLLGAEVPPNLEELSGGFERWLPDKLSHRSVRFGVESAVLHLIAASRTLPLRSLLNDSPRESVSINALVREFSSSLQDTARSIIDSGYRAVKIKVGRDEIQEDIHRVQEFRKLLPNTISLRLDANRAWTIDQALQFANGVQDCRVEYIEEPVKSYSELQSLSRQGTWKLPIAYDETVREILPTQLEKLTSVNAVVLKPSLIGVERTAQFIRRSYMLGLMPVISGVYESGVGTMTLAELAAGLLPDDTPIGLDPYRTLQSDVLTSRIEITDGTIVLPRQSLSWDSLESSLLEEITL